MPAPQANQVRQSPAMEDRQRQQRDLNTPIACTRCHGNYFEEVKVYQYAGLSYGSNDFKVLSPSAKTLLRCLCGKMRVPQARHVPGSPQIKQAYEDYAFSIQRADEYSVSVEPEAFAKVAASPGEVASVKKDLEGKIAGLVTEVHALDQKLKPMVGISEAKTKKTAPKE